MTRNRARTRRKLRDGTRWLRLMAVREGYLFIEAGRLLQGKRRYWTD